ncbi:MAG: hypothetical protein AAF921_10025 [Cyanobacteria bacterium P01_D01_bin.44]
MNKFMARVILFMLVAFVGTEIVSRVLIDPAYFYSLDTYNSRNTSKSPKVKLVRVFSSQTTERVDFLFIGSSRVAATINPQIFKQKDASKTTVVAARGHTSPGIHYQALKTKLSEHPDYLKGAKVFIEYSGSRQYDESFREDQLRVDQDMPHLLLPYLNAQSLVEYLEKSPNSRQTKLEMTVLFLSAAYRSIPFVRENLRKLDSPLLDASEKLITSDGGIRDDQIALAREQAIMSVEQQVENSQESPIITEGSLNESFLAYFHQLITQNGGQLFLYKMPLHSIQKEVYASAKESLNQRVFEAWLSTKDIEVVYNKRFDYTDSDFPDIWHLSKAKRDEFSRLLYAEINARLEQ